MRCHPLCRLRRAPMSGEHRGSPDRIHSSCTTWSRNRPNRRAVWLGPDCTCAHVYPAVCGIVVRLSARYYRRRSNPSADSTPHRASPEHETPTRCPLARSRLPDEQTARWRAGTPILPLAREPCTGNAPTATPNATPRRRRAADYRRTHRIYPSPAASRSILILDPRCRRSIQLPPTIESHLAIQ